MVSILFMVPQVKIEKGQEQQTVFGTIKLTNARKSQGSNAAKGNVLTFAAITKDKRGARDELLSGKNKVRLVDNPFHAVVYFTVVDLVVITIFTCTG